MGKTYGSIDEHLQDWIREQHVFFVGTAPRDTDGHINVSPKGGRGSLVVLAPDRIAYLDITGSGAETIAHVRENGRIVVMFCAFEGRPRIVRLHGIGHIHQKGDASYDELVSHFPDAAFPEVGLRSIIEVEVNRIADSCGYSVPLMSYEGVRPHQSLWIDKKLKEHGPEGIEKYVREKNLSSIDGLPAIEVKGLDQ